MVEGGGVPHKKDSTLIFNAYIMAIKKKKGGGGGGPKPPPPPRSQRPSKHWKIQKTLKNF